MKKTSTLFFAFILLAANSYAQSFTTDAATTKERKYSCPRAITADDVQNMNMSQPDLLKGLEGKVPGMNSKNKTQSDTAYNKPVRITLRCGSSVFQTRLLIIVDGILFQNAIQKSGSEYGNGFPNLNPNDIESFNILKGVNASALFGCSASKGVIIITTKSANKRKVVIKDFLTGEGISGATVSLISSDKKDTVLAFANDSGVVEAGILKHSGTYQVHVSAIGYKSYVSDFNFTYRKVNEILLSRDIKTFDTVFIQGAGLEIKSVRHKISCGVASVQVAVDSGFAKMSAANQETLKIMPTPTRRGGVMVVEMNAKEESIVTIKLSSLAGRLLLTQSQKSIKGLNRFNIFTDSHWASGIYFLHLYANGRLLASSKVILQ